MAQQDFNPRQHSLLQIVIFVIVVLSSSPPCGGSFLTFFKTICTPLSMILHGASDGGRLSVILHLFHFIIFTLTADLSLLLVFLWMSSP